MCEQSNNSFIYLWVGEIKIAHFIEDAELTRNTYNILWIKLPRYHKLCLKILNHLQY